MGVTSGVSSGSSVGVGVNDMGFVDVSVGVGVFVGVDVNVGIGVEVGVIVDVGVGDDVGRAAVKFTVVPTSPE